MQALGSSSVTGVQLPSIAVAADLRGCDLLRAPAGQAWTCGAETKTSLALMENP